MKTPFLRGDCRFLDYGSTVEIGEMVGNVDLWHFDLIDGHHHFNLHPLTPEMLNEFAWQLQALIDEHNIRPLMKNRDASALICVDGTIEPYILRFILGQGLTSVHRIDVTDVDLKKIIELIHTAPFNKEGN